MNTNVEKQLVPEQKLFEIKPGDIRVDTFSSNSTSPISMRLTYVPKGITVSGKAFSRGKLYRDLGAALFNKLKEAGILPNEQDSNIRKDSLNPSAQ